MELVGSKADPLESTQELVKELRRGVYLPVQQRAAERLCALEHRALAAEKALAVIASMEIEEVVPFGKRE